MRILSHNVVFSWDPNTNNFKVVFDGTTIVNYTNNIVSRGHKLIHLGDFILGSRPTKRTKDNFLNVTSAVNGDLALLLGNHDTLKKDVYLNLGFNLVIDNPIIIVDGDEHIEETPIGINAPCVIIEINGKIVMFSHFPVFDRCPFDEKYIKNYNYLESLYKQYKCELNIHGHTHKNNSEFKDAINVCLEVNDYKPLLIDDLIK